MQRSLIGVRTRVHGSRDERCEADELFVAEQPVDDDEAGSIERRDLGRGDERGRHGAFSRNRNNASLYSSGCSKYGECPAWEISTNVAFVSRAALSTISGAGKS